ncbi:helix-turn-helix transcriptional regulator [Methylomonas koyamae]|uniref:AraC family transcriptional regulator n=1 Tax=Methylomonas koyamae TaxID=702114 RepID=A0A291IPG6_9GAMM|nr:AraC family transcriptional regulator [Methylomonas koyamae]ATG92232.1 AraC family transcriptional regulator [Methylomonas koyamae]OAI25025.1 AraC family transcriptional regulator [Methylomonas koyamae]
MPHPAVITAGHYKIDQHDLPLQQLPDQSIQSLPDLLGSGHTAVYQLDADLSYIETRYTPNRDLAISTHIDRQEPRLVVTLGMQGGSRFVEQGGEAIVFNQGYTSITAFNCSNGERQYRADTELVQLRFSLTKTRLEQYIGESASARLFNNGGVKLLSYKPISNSALIAARQLAACNIAPPLKRMFIHGQTMSILAAEIHHLWQNTPDSQYRFTEKDRALAYAARAILINEFRTPPSAAQLAKRIGSNQFKLKQLFHHYFDNTPYGIVLDTKMHTAYRLLETGAGHIDAVAELVGYNHASNFSAAFSKYFGIPPRQIAKPTGAPPKGTNPV